LPETDATPSNATPQASPRRVSVRALAILTVIAVVAYALDRVSKYLVVTYLPPLEAVPVLGPVLQFYFIENPGAAFSLLSGSTWIFAIIASGVVVFILLFARRIRSVGWAVLFGLLLGGTLGNLTDRLTREPGFGRGYVVDFIQVWGFPAIFNIADIAIVSAMGLFILLTLRGVGLDGRRATRERPPVDEASPTDTP